LQEEIEIDENTNAIELEEKIREKAPDIVVRTLLGLVRCELDPCCQDGTCAVYTKKTTKEDKNISFNCDARALHNRIRALVGQYTCQITFKGKIIKVIKSSFVKNETAAECGEILEVSKRGILVKCDKNAILFEIIKPEGKGEMSAYAWSLGSKITKGDSFNA
jgi:methionyl-tRNA formyltransferase